MMSVMLFFFGVVLVMLGITGEYIGRIFEEVKATAYLVCAKTANSMRKPQRHQAGIASP